MPADTEVESEARPERGPRKVQAAVVRETQRRKTEPGWMVGGRNNKKGRGYMRRTPWVTQLAFFPVHGTPPADCDTAAGPVLQAPVSRLLRHLLLFTASFQMLRHVRN